MSRTRTTGVLNIVIIIIIEVLLHSTWSTYYITFSPVFLSRTRLAECSRRLLDLAEDCLESALPHALQHTAQAIKYDTVSLLPLSFTQSLAYLDL